MVAATWERNIADVFIQSNPLLKCSWHRDWAVVWCVFVQARVRSVVLRVGGLMLIVAPSPVLC